MRVGLLIAAFIGGFSIAPAFADDAVKVDITLFQFKPKELVVRPGTTVTWINADAIDHSVTAGAPGKPSEDFDSGFFSKGGSYAHTFVAPGSYAYFCRRHPNMHAVVKVE
ncbi:MAG: cupredoxin domain-containing protein [Pseudomonadota bacterium]